MSQVLEYTQIENGKAKVDAMLLYLSMKYDTRLKFYEGIKDTTPMRPNEPADAVKNPPAYVVFRSTFAAARLRLLKGAMDYLKGETPQYINHAELVQLLRNEKNELAHFGIRFRASVEMYDAIIDYLIQIKK